MSGFCVDLTEGEHAGGTRLHAGAAAHALRIGHWLAFVGKIHYIDALMTDRGAHGTRDALFLFGKNAKATKARVDMHQCGKWTGETTPYATAIPEVGAIADDAGQQQVYAPAIIELYPTDLPTIQHALVELTQRIA